MLTKKEREWLQSVSDLAPNEEDEQVPEGSQKERFRKRFELLEPTLVGLDESIKGKRFYKAEPDLMASVKKYNRARSKVTEASASKKYKTANQAMDVLEAAAEQLRTKAGERLARDAAENRAFDERKRYLNQYAQVKDAISATQARNNEAAFAGKGKALADAWIEFADANGMRAGAELGKRYKDAGDQLDRQVAAMRLLDPPPGPLDQARNRRDALKAQADKLIGGIDAGAYDDLDNEAQAFRTEWRDRLQEAGQALDGNNVPAVTSALDNLESAIQVFRDAAATKLEATAGASKSDGLKSAKKSLRHDPNALRVLMEQPGGRAALDRMMESMGSKAKSADDKEFVKAAILARYKMTALSGDLTTKALPRLYNVLGQVPDAQTFGNDKLQFIERNRKSDNASTYGDLKLTLNVGKTGKDTQKLEQDDDVDAEAKLKPGKVNTFNHTTLHELGHSVDDNDGFMKPSGGEEKYGGWEVHSIDQVADVAGEQKGFYRKYGDNLSQGFLRELLKSTLAGVAWDQLQADPKQLVLADRVVQVKPEASEILAHPAVRQAQTDRDRLLQTVPLDLRLASDLKRDLRGRVQMDVPNFKVVCAVIELILGAEMMEAKKAAAHVISQLVVLPENTAPDYEDMKTHAAVTWCDSLRAVPKEVWERCKGGVDAFKAGDRVYFQDRNNWRSYKSSARKKGVSQYQFKSYQEWFAELYAAYHMDKLPPSHPDHGWLAENYGHQDT